MDMSRFNGLPSLRMSVHSYSRCWVHLIWGTLNREKLLHKQAAAPLSRYLSEYADTKSVYMKINYVNADQVHALVDLSTNLSIEELMQLLKGSSSHWVNVNNILQGKFARGEATAPFRCRNLMSHRLLPTLPGKRNIIGCAPSRKSFGNLSSAMAYAGRMRKAVETAYVHRGGGRTGLKAGVNESVPSGSSR